MGVLNAFLLFTLSWEKKVHSTGDASDAKLSLGLLVVKPVRFLSPFLAREKDTILTYSLYCCSAQSSWTSLDSGLCHTGLWEDTGGRNAAFMGPEFNHASKVCSV